MGEHEADVPEIVRAFIVGSSRSGSNWLANCLNTHPDIAVFGETAFWGRRFVEPEPDGRYGRQQLNLVLQRQVWGGRTTPASSRLGGKRGAFARVIDGYLQDAYRPTPAELFSAALTLAARAEGKKVAIEKTPHHVNWLPRIAEHYPKARFIVLMREPYGFMLSYKHQGDRRGKDDSQRFDSVYHPLGCALVWRGYARSTQDALNRYVDRAILVTYDRLVDNPLEVVRWVERFLDRQNGATVLPRRNSSFPDGSRPQLTGQDIFWMNLVAKREMVRLGFEPMTHRAGAADVLRSVAEIPPWGVGMARRLLGQGTPLTRYVYRWLR